MREIKLNFDSVDQAKIILSDDFPNWDGIESPFTGPRMDTLVVVKELLYTDENGNVLPPAWSGINIDLLYVEDTDKYSDFEIQPATPSHRFL